jgi:hypothetical protein
VADNILRFVVATGLARCASCCNEKHRSNTDILLIDQEAYVMHSKFCDMCMAEKKCYFKSVGHHDHSCMRRSKGW